jgi:hypothetical protein
MSGSKQKKIKLAKETDEPGMNNSPFFSLSNKIDNYKHIGNNN